MRRQLCHNLRRSACSMWLTLVSQSPPLGVLHMGSSRHHALLYLHPLRGPHWYETLLCGWFRCTWLHCGDMRCTMSAAPSTCTLCVSCSGGPSCRARRCSLTVSSRYTASLQVGNRLLLQSRLRGFICSYKSINRSQAVADLFLWIYPDPMQESRNIEVAV